MAFKSKEAERAYKRKWYASRPNKEAARRKRDREKNPGRDAATQRAQYKRNPDAQREASDKWRREHSEEWREQEWRRWVRRTYGELPEDDIQLLKTRREFNVGYRGYAGPSRLAKR